MNKLTKIGVSALCGSLATVASAQAGALSVTGGATATWSSNEGAETGNPIGLSSGILFTGTGELDNGTAITLTLSQTDQSAYSAGSIALATPSLGTFTIDQGAGGTGIDRYDDKMPTAWEETTGTSLGTGLQTVGGVSGAANVDWNLSSDMLPDGMSAAIAWTPKHGTGLGANDKAAKGGGEGSGNGWDIAVAHTGLYDGLEVFAGYSTLAMETDTLNNAGDRTQTVIGATYAMGGVTVGYQQSLANNNLVNGAGAYYDNEAYGVSFSVNDDLAISYGVHESEKGNHNGVANVTNKAESLQISYSMGGASIKLAETSVDNGSYVSGTSKDRDATTLALTLAF